MSIKDLLSKVKRSESTTPDLTTEQVRKEPIHNQEIPIENLSFKALMDRYTEIRSWLETHECQSGTNNKLDANDRAYDHEKYCNKLKELEDTSCKILNRPLTEGLEEQIRNYGL